MKRRKTIKAITAVGLAAFYFFSLAPELLAWVPPSPTARPSATPVPGTPPLSAPATQAVCPVVFSISPSSLRQGQTATLVLSGSALNKLSSVSLGTGITVKSLNNANPGSAQVAVEVAANAPVGPHVLMLIAPGAVAATGAATGCGTREARPRLQILPRTTEQTPGFIAPPTQPQKPPITAFPPGTVSPLTSAPIPDNEKKLLATSLYPNQWARGQSYTANLVGLGFTTDMQIQLGEGVQVVGPLKLFSPNLVQIKIEVSGSAAIGEHRVQLRLNNQDPWTMTQAAAWVQSPSSQGLALMQLPAQDLASLVLGKIDLLQPVYNDSPGAANFINDATVFRWQEENPGLADWYELRFLDNNGQILLKRRIDPVAAGEKPPTYYKPDQAFFDDMCQHKPYGLCGYNMGHNAVMFSFFWEVAGYKLYYPADNKSEPSGQTGLKPVVKTSNVNQTKIKMALPSSRKSDNRVLVSQGGLKEVKAYTGTLPVNVEVEISEQRKVDGPIQPNGLACQNGEMKTGLDGDSQVQIVNLDIAKGRPAGTANTVNFVNDQFKMFGNFRFWYTPYDYQAGAVSGGNYTAFSNIFVDWGDGTTQPLVGIPYKDTWGDTRMQIPESMYQHRYTSTGKKIFRIFMLPTADIQNTDPAQVTAYYDSQNNPSGADPYFAVLTAGGLQAYGFSGGQSGPSLADLAKHAHVLYCKEIVIDPRQDPITNGPLHLVSVEITGANGRGFNEPVESVNPPQTPKAQVGAIAKKQMVSQAGSIAKGVKAPQQVKAQGPSAAGKAQPGTIKNIGPVQANPSVLYDASDMSLSQCDVLQLNASLTYYGKGEAWIAWRMNTNLEHGGINDAGGILVASQYPVLIGPSKSRDMAQIPPEQAGQATTASYDTYPLDSPIQKMEGYPIGKAFSLKPEVTVGPETVKALTAQAIAEMLQALIGSHAQSSADTSLAALRIGMGPEATVSDAGRAWYWEPGQIYAANLPTQPLLLAKAAAKTPAPKSNASQTGAGALAQAIKKSGAKLGVLSPFKEGGGMPMVAGINSALKQPQLDAAPQYDTTFPKQPPYYAAAKALSYKAVPNSPDKPCKFLFTTKSQDVFEIVNLQDVKGDAQGRYWGHGTLEIKLFTGSFLQRYKRLLPIKISGWLLSSDQLNVVAGALIKENLGDAVPPAAGMEIMLEKIEGKAYQTDLNLTLSIAPQDKRLRVPGSSEPVAWKNRTARLTAFGDWFYFDKTPKEIAIGWSGFRLQCNYVALDLSSVQNLLGGGQIQNDTGVYSAGPEWTGIHLGQALLIPNTATLSGSNPYNKTVNNWGIIEGGLCGNADLGVFSTTRKGGTIGWDSLHANADRGNFNAVYNNMKVEIPWPYAELKGNAVLADGSPGQDSFIDFRNVKADKVTRNYGTIIMETSDFVFGMYSQDFPAVDWAVKANARFSFKQEGQVYSTDTVVQDVVFGLDALAYHKGDVEIPLNGKANFGAVPLDLVSVHVSGFGSKNIKFDLKTKFSVSEVLEAVDVPLTYGLSKQSSSFMDDYQAVNPVLQPFNIQVAYPAFQPKVTAQMTIKYGKAAKATAGLKQERPLYASVDPKLIQSTATDAASPVAEEMLLADSGSGTEDSFNTESINMQLLGESMPNVEFRLGYKDGHDYWLMRVKVNTGIMPLAPPFLYAYQIRGGLGHNFPIETFSSPGSIYDIEPVINGSYLFNAGIIAGSTDKFLYVFDGDFTISTAEGALLTFKAWLLSSDHSGEGQFHGHIQYADGGFEGAMGGSFSILDGTLSIGTEGGAEAIQIALNSSEWYFRAGTQYGPKVDAHVIFMDFKAYLDISNQGLKLGIGYTFEKDLGNCDKVCIGVDAYLTGDIQIGVSPLSFGAGLSGGAGAKLCVWKFGCLHPHFDFGCSLGAPNPVLFHMNFDICCVPCPVDCISFHLNLLPEGSWGWSIDWCDCFIFDC